MAKKQEHREAVEAPGPWTMPAVEVGMGVLWWDDLGEYEAGAPANCAGVVTVVGPRTVSLGLYVERSLSLMVREGVRHATDPDRELIRNAGEGVWDYPAWYKDVLRRLHNLESLFGEITGK